MTNRIINYHVRLESSRNEIHNAVVLPTTLQLSIYCNGGAFSVINSNTRADTQLIEKRQKNTDIR